MSPLKGYVGPTETLRKTFRRSITANHPDDIVLVRGLLNQIPADQGGPEKKLSLFDDVTLNPIFQALKRFQEKHGIVNRRTGKAYGWTGPRGETLAAMYRLASRGSRPEPRPGYLDVSRMSYNRVANNFHRGAKFRRRAGDHVFSSRGSLNEARRDVNTCALRVSYALLKAGKRLRPSHGSWKYQKGAGKAWLTSTAERLADELAGGEFVVSKRDIVGRKGIIVFLGGFNRATGHVTLWNGTTCHFGSREGQWEFPTIYFFEMKG